MKTRERREHDREAWFGAGAAQEVWRPKKKGEGAFVQMPRVLSLLSRGHVRAPIRSAARVLLWELWSTTWDERVLTVDLAECAYLLGLKGQRGARTVDSYLDELATAGLVKVHRKFGGVHVLLRNPYKVLEEWRRDGHIDEEGWYHTRARIADFGGPVVEDQAEDDRDGKVRPIGSARTPRPPRTAEAS